MTERERRVAVANAALQIFASDVSIDMVGGKAFVLWPKDR